ncbi:hypothetical protein [Actinospica sp.]|uniref:hypothetical protein n=1 Tax=Actinospica sp. TaxID=1872142 RepID=UPI002BDD4673|nr:hypothetical protein [Actinospica sp.]HWG22850.1 hypothetical protein [Actinospica sp.]
MTTSDWILDIVLILVVLRQIRWSRIDATTVLLPLGIVAFVAHKYLSPIPTGGNDLLVIGVFAAVGLALGVAGGLTTHVRLEQGKVFVRAGFVAAGLWILSMGGRLAFAIWSEHSGGPTLVRFSEQHQITSIQAWVSALILMVLCEVCTRVGTIVIRANLAKRAAATSVTGDATSVPANNTAMMMLGVSPLVDAQLDRGSVTDSCQVVESLVR